MNPGTTNSVQLHRIIRAPAERVYRAFLDARALVKWLPPHGFTGTVHHLDATVGGGFRMSFTNFSADMSHSFYGTYQLLIPHEKIVYTNYFEDPQLPGEVLVSISLRPNMIGTDVQISQTGIPAAIPTEFCYAGWQDSLALLSRLVEPSIPAVARGAPRSECT